MRIAPFFGCDIGGFFSLVSFFSDLRGICLNLNGTEKYTENTCENTISRYIVEKIYMDWMTDSEDIFVKSS